MYVLDIITDFFINSSYVILQDVSVLLQEMIPVIMAMVLVRNGDARSAKIILGFYFMRILITMVTTIIGLQTFPGASRDLGMVISLRKTHCIAFIYLLILEDLT